MKFAERYILSKLKTSEISFEPKSFEHPAPNGLEEMSRILKDLSDKNIPFEDYQRARSTSRFIKPIEAIIRGESFTHHWNGVTHEEAMDALQKGLGQLPEYKYKGLGSYSYGKARAMGVTHSELEEVHSLGENLVDYASARASGASHSEVIEHIKSTRPHFLENGRGWFGETSPGNYGLMRASGASHAEAMQVPIKHQLNYGLARSSGASHPEIMHAISKDVDLYHYAHARDLNFSEHTGPHGTRFGDDSGFEDMSSHAKTLSNERAMGIKPTGFSHDEAMKFHESGDLPFFEEAQRSGELDAGAMLNAEKTGLNVGRYVRGLSAAYQTQRQKWWNDLGGESPKQESPKQEPTKEEVPKESCETCGHYDSELAKHKETTEKNPSNINKILLDRLTNLKNTHMQNHTEET